VSKQLLIVAGEVSGDMHGSVLIKKLLSRDPELEISGIGGDMMISAGMEALFHIKDFSFLGITEVVRHLPFIREVQRKLLETIEKRNIRTVLLIDYPGFNLNFAKKLKKRNIKVLYYISPQLWAWGSHRVKKIKKRIDRLFVVFPFEVDFFKKHGIKAEFVGHPLVERIENYEFEPKSEFFKNIGIDGNADILLLMPGSRKHEVELILPELIKAGRELERKFNIIPVIAATENFDDSFYLTIGKDSEIKIVRGYNYELLKYSKFGIIKSGTSTLEAGLFKLPFIVVYKTSLITYLIAKRLVNLDSLSLVNIVTKRKIVLELIQNEVNKNEIVKAVSSYLSDESKVNGLLGKLSLIKNLLVEEKKKVDLTSNILEEIYAS
jgi:lipid-A-disaccharide synthase